MVKILAQAGMSLADVYNVVGSSAGVEQLESREVSLVHEMGGTLFSERLGSSIRRLTTGDILQTVTFNGTLAGLGANAIRILGISVFADVNARIDRVVVSLRDPLAGREIPIWVWNTASDAERAMRLLDNAGAVASVFQLVSIAPINVPNLMTGSEQPRRVSEIVMRGITATFGAGTVELILLVHTASSHQGGLNSRGLPIPGW